MEMFGIVNARMPLTVKRTVGIRNVYSQYASNKEPIMFDPTKLPSRPDISERQSAMALLKKCL